MPIAKPSIDAFKGYRDSNERKMKKRLQHSLLQPS